jgi:GWxTD domain-containing protein
MKNRHKRARWTTQIGLILFVFSLVGCGGGPKIKLDPASKNFYETARLIMSKQEKKIFDHLPDKESREAFIKEFWSRRDPDPDTEENEFKEEFYRRIEYANSHFLEGGPGWNTDRGRMYVYFGDPDRRDQAPMLSSSNLKGWILWVYYRYGFAVYFFDRRGDGQYVLEPAPAELGGSLYGDFSDAIEEAKLGYLPHEDSLAKKFMNFKVDYDKQDGEFLVSLPTDALVFKEEESVLNLDLDFSFVIYEETTAAKEEMQHSEHFETTEDEILNRKEITFTIPKKLMPGKYFVDVVINVKPDMGKVRKIFDIKV